MYVDPHNLILKPDINCPASGYSGTQIALLTWKGYRGFPRSIVVEEQTVLDSFAKLENILHQNPASLELVALLNLGAVSYEEHNYPLAVILGWVVCERLRPRSEKLPEALRRKQEKVKNARNKWLHHGVSPSREIAEAAIESASERLAEVLSTYLRLPLACGLTF